LLCSTAGQRSLDLHLHWLEAQWSAGQCSSKHIPNNIGSDGAIAYADVNPDYTTRPDPSELLPGLDTLAARRAA
jgi:hypothetical protein